MITIRNYKDQIKDIKNLPASLSKAREFVDKISLEGSNWDVYHSSNTVKKTVDLFFEKLNAFVASKTPSIAKKKSIKAKPKAVKTKPKKKRKLSKSEEAYERAEKMELVSLELKFIRRFVRMHGRIKSRNHIRLFINALQKAIAERRVRKSSKYAKDIEDIQGYLINLHSRFRSDNEKIEVVIGESKRTHYLSLIGKQTELRSVKLLKSYINLQGKVIVNQKAKNLYNRIARAINSGKLSKSDKYFSKVEMVLDKLKSFVQKNPSQGMLSIPKKELNGLQGIVDDCECKELNGFEDPKPVIPRNTIMASTDIVKLDFDKLGFKGKWLKLIGDPSKGFTAMIFGKPKMGKSYLSVDFAGYLARNHGTVLYVAREEGIDDTLQQKLKDKNVAHPDLFVSDYLPEDLGSYDFVFLDSVNKLGLSPESLESLTKRNPDTSFINIFQTTKQGAFRGGNEFQHDVDIVIEVPEKGQAVQFGRFNQGGEINIFP